jgi:hypothetical protein
MSKDNLNITEEEKLEYQKMMSTPKGQSRVYQAMIEVLEKFSIWKKKNKQSKESKSDMDSIRQQINDL